MSERVAKQAFRVYFSHEKEIWGRIGMPRPTLGDSDSKRLQMVITEDELNAIDVWQHDHRIPSKSEAIRRLVQIGMRVERALPAIARDIADVLDLAAEAIDIPEEIFATIEADEVSKAEVDSKIAQRLFDNVNFTFNRQIETQNNLFHLLVELAPLVQNSALSEAIKAADAYAADETPNKVVMSAVGATRRVQVEMWRKRRAKHKMSRNSRGSDKL